MFARKMKGAFLLAAVMTLLVTAAAAETGDTSKEEKKLGLVVSVSGDVTVLRTAGPLPAIEGFVLESSDTILVKMGAHCSGFTPGGEHFDIKGPGKITFTAPEKGKQRNRIAAWIARQVAHWIGESRDYTLVSRSMRDWKETTEPLRLIVPAPESSVRASRAQFYWSTIPAVERYELIITPEDGEKMVQVVRGFKAVKTDLKPGVTYYWTVRPQADEVYMSAVERTFRVMTLEEERNLEGSLSELPDLEAGVLLLSAGLHDEAIYRFDAAVASDIGKQSALRWRSKALAAIELYAEAYRDLSETLQ